MKKIRTPAKAVLFTGILYNERVVLDTLIGSLRETFGPILLKSEAFSFTETDYYKREMGDLTRLWLGFDRFIEQDEIVDIKILCNRLEADRYSTRNKRDVNLDPGYLTRGKVVLATTKDNQHRLYLSKNIYGEVTLRYKNGSYIPWEWTYRDYKRNEAMHFFIQLRSVYTALLEK
jgi:hypothetical protein